MTSTHRSVAKSTSGLPLTGTIRADIDDGDSTQPLCKKAFLTVIRGGADLGFHALIRDHDRTIIGRDPTCAFPLQDNRVSRQHAVIMPIGAERYIIEDLSSTNGTRVNGTLIVEPYPLHDGEKILVGETVIRFALADDMDIDFHQEVAALLGTDPLTGLPSKRRFDEALEFALQTSQHAGGTLAVLMMDMDGVKRINDTHGHLFGAHVISETGKHISRVLGKRGSACRFGGDEFTAFLPGHDLNAALAIAEQIRLAVETANMSKDGIPLKPTISIGLACYPESGQSLIDLIAVSDKALYRAKAQGKNCVAT
jgi:diguanylate cyclase (GGDEF)-like protein